jgi:hypothetical protein
MRILWQNFVHHSNEAVENFMRNVDYEMSGAMSYPLLESRLLYIVDSLSTSETQALLNTISDPVWVAKAKCHELMPGASLHPLFFVCAG